MIGGEAYQAFQLMQNLHKLPLKEAESASVSHTFVDDAGAVTHVTDGVFVVTVVARDASRLAELTMVANDVLLCCGWSEDGAENAA